MENKKYRLPEREWYSLNQAVKYIQYKTNFPIDINDLWHYFYIGKLEACICINVNNDFIQIGDFKIERKNAHFIENPTLFIDGDDVSVLGDEDETEININDVFDKQYWGDNKVYRGFLTVLPNINNYAFIENVLVKRGLQLSFCNQLTIPRVKGYKEVKLFYLQFEKTEEFNAWKEYLSPDEVYILHESLENFLNGNTEEFERVNKALKRGIGRPKTKTNDVLLELGRINARYYPTASANKLAKAVRKYLISTGIKENEIITDVEILRKFKQNGIGASKKKIENKLEIPTIYTE